MSERADAGAHGLAEIRAFLTRVCAADELDERLEIPGASAELAGTVEALNAFLDKLWVQSFQLGAKQEMLEKVVEIRTREVHEILDNVDTGFLLTILDETVLDNFSRSCVEIFGTSDIKGRKLSDLLNLSPSQKTLFSLSHQQVFEDVLPPEVSTGQLPSEFEANGRSYAIRGTHICDGSGKVAKVFFTINDNTELRKVEAENALRRALIEIVRQKDSFAAFLRETAKAFDKARRAPSQMRYRNVLHTLKGNLGCFGLLELARLVHTLEDGPEISDAQLDLVENTLRKFLSSQSAVIGLDYPSPSQGAQRVELERLRAQLAAVVEDPDLGRRRARLDELIKKSAWVTAEALIAPLRGTCERVAERLEKPVVFEVKGQQMLVDPERLGSVFASLGHVIRNSLDHGLEPAGERGHKPEHGRITLTCSEDPSAWAITISDDGRGIDLDKLARAALDKGRITLAQLATMSPDERARLVFLDGVTTKDVATLESGRGVGMAALLESVELEGGSVRVETQAGLGTTFQIRVPKAAPPARPSAVRRSFPPA